MKCITWNVNSVKARKDHLLKYLEQEKPDIAFLQELKTDGEHYPESDVQALGYSSVINGQKGYAGVATLVREGLDYEVHATELLEEGDQARMIDIEVDGVRLINIYAPNGNPIGSEKFDYKMKWYKALEARLYDLLGRDVPVMIGGDFNIIPEHEDCYDSQAWTEDALFIDVVRNIYKRLIYKGFYDAFRVRDKRAGQYSFWDYQAGAWPQNKGIRIDHFLLSPELVDRLHSCKIDANPRGWEKPSDHTPVIIELADEKG